MLPETTRRRLNTQLDSLGLLLEGMPPSALMLRPDREQWSAHENLAHLARHHELFLERLRRIKVENGPNLGRYRAEDDPSWPGWAAHTTDEVLNRLQSLRAEIVEYVSQLSEADLGRTGVHPLFGTMNVVQWLEFFLLHEAHHLYLVMLRLGQAEQAIRTGDEK